VVDERTRPTARSSWARTTLGSKAEQPTATAAFERTNFTHPSVSIFDRSPFRLTDEHFLSPIFFIHHEGARGSGHSHRARA
jgi:hypothetical protein